MKKIMIINGANLNFLGIREKNIYGLKSYDELCSYIRSYFIDKNLDLTFKQSNIEGELINFIQEAYLNNYDGIVLNAGAYTHTSIALYDAIKSVQDKIKTIEVHLSNIGAREDFRKKSLIAPACYGSISGFSYNSYILAILGLENIEKEEVY